MSDYRLHLLDQKMKIFELREVACDTDADAMSNAYGVLAKCHAVEVWIGARMVARVPRPILTARRKTSTSSQSSPSFISLPTGYNHPPPLPFHESLLKATPGNADDVGIWERNALQCQCAGGDDTCRDWLPSFPQDGEGQSR